MTSGGMAAAQEKVQAGSEALIDAKLKSVQLQREIKIVASSSRIVELNSELKSAGLNITEVKEGQTSAATALQL